MNTQNNNKNNEIPDRVLNISEEFLGSYPSIIETDFYTIDSIKLILSKNELMWSKKYFDGDNTIYKNGLINFSNDSLIYFIRRENENTYKFYFLSKEKSTDGLIFYLNKLKEFKTIT
jgi:hypothetical protein